MPLPDHPTRCSECEAPAVVRFAPAGPAEPAATALALRSQYRCTSHRLTLSDLAELAEHEPTWLLVVDPRFTPADAVGVSL